MKKDIGNRMALAGIGATISLVFVVLAYFVKTMSLSFTVLSAIGVMFPLTKKYYRESLLTCIAVSVAGFFIVNISILSFILASGFYVVLTIFLYNKNFNRWLGYGLKILYAGLVFFLFYKLLTLITIDIGKLPFLNGLSAAGLYAILNLIFALAFLIYDFLVEKGFDYLCQVMKKINKSK